MTDIQAIRQCVTHCANARDGRGRWRHEDALLRDLMRNGSTLTIASETAAASARFGAWLKERAEWVAGRARA